MIGKIDYIPPPSFYIPDTLRKWPWKRDINPHYVECKAESSTWLESFRAFDPKAQHRFNMCDFNLLAALAYPRLNKPGCRIGCDLMNVFFVFDEHSDVADVNVVRKQAAIIMHALRNPHEPRPMTEWIGGEITRQFWANATKTMTKTSQQRFVDAFDAYTSSVVQEAGDRDGNRLRDIESYMKLRRETIGARPSFAILEIEMDIPDYVIRHPIIEAITKSCVDIIIIGNDICSYNVEQAGGNTHNLIGSVMHEFQIGLQEALQWISDLNDELVQKVLSDFARVPTFDGGIVDEQVAIYVDGLGNWVQANDSWSFESQRYFGTKGLEIQRHRHVALLTYKGGTEVLGNRIQLRLGDERTCQISWVLYINGR
ncbi:terpenoid synthase [Hysterangium stoloniferum]|nr:terpenoid synthase [Hysterangium stoloniferum]